MGSEYEDEANRLLSRIQEFQQPPRRPSSFFLELLRREWEKKIQPWVWIPSVANLFTANDITEPPEHDGYSKDSRELDGSCFYREPSYSAAAELGMVREKSWRSGRYAEIQAYDWVAFSRKAKQRRISKSRYVETKSEYKPIGLHILSKEAFE